MVPPGYHQTPPPLLGIGVWVILPCQFISISLLVSGSSGVGNPVFPSSKIAPSHPRVWNIVYLALSVYKHQSSGLWGLEALVLVPVAQLWVGHHPCRVAIQVGIVSAEKKIDKIHHRLFCGKIFCVNTCQTRYL